MKYIILTLILISISKYSNGQSPSEYYTIGSEFLKKNNFKEAKYNFNKLIELAPEDYGGYNFYGICLFSERKYDSCVYYLKKSIELNSLNNKHSREMTISRLIRTYIYLEYVGKLYFVFLIKNHFIRCNMSVILTKMNQVAEEVMVCS